MLKKILILRPDGIGDFIIFTAVLEEYKRIFNYAEIDLLCHPSVKPLAEAMPYFRRIICIDHLRIFRKKCFFQMLFFRFRALFMFYDVVIYPVYSRTRGGDEFVRIIRAKEKIGFDGDDANDQDGKRFSRNVYFTRVIESEKRPTREMERHVEFINKLSGNDYHFDLKTKICFKEDDGWRFDKLLLSRGLTKGKYVCVFPGAGYSIKLWEVTKWVDLIKKIREVRDDLAVLILGGVGDIKETSAVLEKLDSHLGVIDLSGILDLRLIAKLIEGAVLLLSTDTSAIHIAAAVGTPNVCIMGGGHFGRFYPYGDLTKNRIVYKKMCCFSCNWRCKYETPKCIREIQVEDVWKELASII